MPKHELDERRLTPILRPVKRVSNTKSFPLPVIKAKHEKATGAVYFIEIDLIQACWQLQKQPSSCELHSFITLGGIYLPTRILHRTFDTNFHPHSTTMTTLLAALRGVLLLRVDGMFVLARRVDALPECVEQLLCMCQQLSCSL